MVAEVEHAEAFSALGQLSRLRIYFHLVKAGGEVAAGEIQTALDIPAPTLSHHLEVLRRAEVIEARPEGRFIWYRANRNKASELVRLLTACC